MKAAALGFRLASSCWVISLTGCVSTGRVVPDPPPPTSYSVAAADADRLWAAAEQTLRQQQFGIDRLDRRTGLMTTFPVGSQHWFEFWRRDVATTRDWAEASLNPIRRWVEVSVAPDAPTESSDVARLTVSVHKERLSTPDRQFNSSGAAYQYFGSSLPSTTGAVRVAPLDDRWLNQGRDTAMEARLLAAIIDQFRSAPLPAPPLSPN